MNKSLIYLNRLYILIFVISIFTFSSFVNAKTLTEVRSAFIFQMSKFIEFPPPSLNTINFCFFDNEQGPGKLLHSKKGLYSQKLPVKVIILNKVETTSELNQQCNIIYLDEKIQSQVNQEWINKIKPSIVVIGETIEFLNLGGLAALIQKGNKIRLYINKDKLSQSQVKIESRLLALAKFHPQ
ncbi:YfiR family protein [Pseudoalteromonas denitrificans]|uniref:DUF4154 domain-containing protein n=1 Tax=Pseudoalteromonas denitrificans DSM 6059 TaxID=1123010 RepID=A0A1I1PUK7_9GAMM|nr:YfiR family protein [Pseudoalteromonas denitrificans]SFD11288.1 protein of unknown function [Pseudoalteromonas denitrificans DSM 6059]